MSINPTYSIASHLNLQDHAGGRQASLTRALREAIVSGALKRGERLPSSRTLAQDLKLSRNTVVQALDRLRAEGLIAGKTGSGTFITADMSASTRRLQRRKPSSRVAALTHKPASEMVQPLTPGTPALDVFPRQQWGRLAARWARDLSFSELGYGDPAGMAALRQAIAAFIGATRGVACAAEQVIITSGSQGAITTAAMLVGEVGDVIALENPGYPAVHNMLAVAGLRAELVDVDGDGLRVGDISDAPRLVVAAPSHQYPLGVTMSMERRLALLDWAERRDGWIIEDDYDGEFRYDGHPLPALSSLDKTGERVLYVGTLSKVLSPAIRLGYLVVPDQLIDAASALRSALDRGVSTMIQAICADFIADGLLALHIKKTQQLYQERREVLAHQMTRAGFEPLGSEAGLHMTIPLDRLDDRATIAEMRARGLGGNPLSGYYTNREDARHGLVLGFANATADHSQRAAETLGSLT